jgi:putative ABC transport system permease protein
MLSGLSLDVKAALRSLASHRRLAAVAVVALGLGVGANFAIFTLVTNILLTPLPYSEPERIVSIWERGATGSELHVAAANFLDWQRDGNRFFEAMAAHTSYRFGGRSTVLGGGRPSQAWVAPVTADFFAVFDIDPLHGRLFTQEETRAGGPPAAIVSHELWSDLLDGQWPLETSVLDIEGTLYPVVGVMPRVFTFPA